MIDIPRGLQGVRAAIGFGTILPVGRSGSFSPDRLPLYLPYVGLVLGALVALCDGVVGRLWSSAAAAVVDVVVLVVFTGALHLDGVADTADGIFSHRSRERALEIMKDSRVGSMGMVAVMVLLALKTVGVYGVQAHRSLLLILIPAYARCSVFFALRHLPYGRPQGGIVSGIDSSFPLRDHWGLGLLLVASLFLGWSAWWLALGFAATTAAMIGWYRRTLACVTGDMLGAMIETTETALFLIMSMRWLAGSG